MRGSIVYVLTYNVITFRAKSYNPVAQYALYLLRIEPPLHMTLQLQLHAFLVHACRKLIVEVRIV